MQTTKFLAACAFFLLLGSQIQAQSSEVSHHTFVVPYQFTKVNIDLNTDNVEIRPIKGTRIFVEQHIKINSDNHHLLNFLIQQKRYELEFTTDEANKSMYLSDKKNNPKVEIREMKFEEHCKYIIFVPTSVVDVNLTNSSQHTAATK